MLQRLVQVLLGQDYKTIKRMLFVYSAKIFWFFTQKEGANLNGAMRQP